MTHYVTVATFTLPSEMAVIRAKMESEGIACYASDEMTVQVYNFMSNAVGGIKLQVEEKDAERARALLKEWGHLPKENPENTGIWVRLNRMTYNWPWIGKLRVELRFLILLGFLALVPMVFLYVWLNPSVEEQLMEQEWCFRNLIYENNNYYPRTTAYLDGPMVLTMNSCEETLRFKENGQVILPGFRSAQFTAQWEMVEDEVHIFSADTFQHIFEGFYNVQVNERVLILESEQTMIQCGTSHISFHF